MPKDKNRSNPIANILELFVLIKDFQPHDKNQNYIYNN